MIMMFHQRMRARLVRQHRLLAIPQPKRPWQAQPGSQAVKGSTLTFVD
jgi:hypothetical protein